MRRIILILCLLAGAATAQDRTPSHCIALADANPALHYVHRAAYGDPLPAEAVRLNYVDHSTFLLETAGGLTAATDYTGFIGVGAKIPDVVTMNNAHSSHWTAFPDPAIPHVLQGWAQDGKPAEHHLDLGEMLVRNVPTDTRGRFDTGARVGGNSIFVFEVAGLCIGHLGHLHHEPDAAQYAAIGRLDVVMAPVDGGMTLDLPSMLNVVGRLRSSIIIPMHWFSEFSLQQFLDGVPDGFDKVRPGQSDLTVSLNTLPGRPTVFVLEPAFLRSPED